MNISIPKMPCDAIKEPHYKDNVSYSYTTNDNKSFTHADKRCYVDLIPFLCECKKIVLKENNRCNKGLPKKVYFDWIELCKKNKLVPENVEANYCKKNGATLEIKNTGQYNRHQLYSCLVIFRFYDSWRNIPWEILYISELMPDLDFFQILQYAQSKHLTNTNHSFLYVGKSIYFQNVDPAPISKGVAAKLFFQNIEDFSSSNECSNTMINDIEMQLLKHSDINHEKYRIGDEIISYKWKPLFEIDKINSFLFMETFNKIFTSGGKTVS